MKKIYTVILCAFCAMAVFSCQKEIDNTPEIPGDEVIPEGYILKTLTATCEETKTTLDGTSIKWADGDQLKVYCSDASVQDFDLVDGIGNTSGSFQGSVPAGATMLYAVYPAALYSSVSGTTMKVTVPAAQTGVFGAGMAVSGAAVSLTVSGAGACDASGVSADDAGAGNGVSSLSVSS